MVGQFRLQRSLQDCFRELFQQAVLADDVFRLLVIGQQLINECLVDGHRFPFSSSDGRLHSPFYTLNAPTYESSSTVSTAGSGDGSGRIAISIGATPAGRSCLCPSFMASTSLSA